MGAVQILELRYGAGADDVLQGFTARILSVPAGRVLVVAIGVVVLGFAVNEFRKSWREDWEEELGTVEGSERARRFAYALGRFGYAARGLAYGLVGWYFLVAAWQGDAEESGGLDRALTQTAATGWGVVALWVITAGFVSYGVFCLFIARYRKAKRCRAAPFWSGP